MRVFVGLCGETGNRSVVGSRVRHRVMSETAGIRDSGFGIRDSGFGIRDSGFGIWDSGFGIRDSGFGIRDSGFGIRDSGFGIRGDELNGSCISCGKRLESR